MIIVIVASVLVFLALFVGCVAWRFWRKRRRASQNATGQVEGVHSHANPKHIDIEDPDPKHRTGTKSGNPEIIRNFVASKRNEKNTNKTQDITVEEKLPEGTKSKEIARWEFLTTFWTTSMLEERKIKNTVIRLPFILVVTCLTFMWPWFNRDYSSSFCASFLLFEHHNLVRALEASIIHSCLLITYRSTNFPSSILANRGGNGFSRSNRGRPLKLSW